MPPRIVVTDHAFADTRHEQSAAAALGAAFEEHAVSTEADTARVVAEADVAFVNFAPMTERVIAAMKPGSSIIRYGIGVDNVDLAAATARGVRVANVPDYGVETVADHAAASLVALARRLPFYDRAIRTDIWVAPTGLGPVRSLRQHTVGLLGFGRIAQAVHQRMRSFGATTIAHDPFCPAEVFAAAGVESVSLAELAVRTTALSVHAPLTPDTEHVINAEFLASMPPGSVVVNTARGGLIDEAALAAALDSGHLAGAALDVTRPEPVPADSHLRATARLLLTPHAAFYDEESLDNLQRLASEEAVRAVTGEPLRCQVA
ncbi:C-terminal binding protein [Leucobacter luti]|uniref:D-3-phosphoglycerate dehydrogenase n=1 Tax=Leucobacter luti TaxID=340320 RepID=A0A4Q7U0V5_9MICO|nr:C-terminal binding protein [Leucobacter luti]MBL3699363.1 C-terminal binding protein [Leucobacter luti]RZT66873.1 D-3-phosphoglycerate dehydrogenase [Leucobacter luti]